MYKISFALITVILLSACGGSGGSPASGGTGGGGSAPTVNGTAATGAAMVGVVNIYGAGTGSVLNIPIDINGQYSADVTGLTPPYFLCAEPTDNTLAPQYSYAAGAGTANITPLTTLALFYANGNSNPAALINSWPGAAGTIAAKLPKAQAIVNANFKSVDFTMIDPTLNTDFTTYDFFTTSFNIGDIIDKILDLLGIDLSSGTPVITINNHPFTFNPAINISGINIGGASGGTGNTGSLTISGNDTSAIGTSFTPNFSTASGNNLTLVVAWSDFNTNADLNLEVVSGKVFSIGYSISFGTLNGTLSNGSITGKSYSYNLVCINAPAVCNKISVDAANKKMTLNNVPLAVFNSVVGSQFGFQDAATAPITLNGSLTWK